MPFQFVVRSHISLVEGCCGVMTMHSLEAHYETFRAKEGVEYPDLYSERQCLQNEGFLAFEKKFPDEAKKVMEKCNAFIAERLRELEQRPAALYVAWFQKSYDEDNEEFYNCFNADALRIAMMRHPGYTNLGAFRNPNTDNIIHGIQLANVDRETDHEDND